MKHRHRICTFFLASSIITLASCTTDAEKPSTGNQPPAGNAETLNRLARADAVDGKVDKVVHKCAGCSLGMDGTAEFELAVQDYKMHFCKTACLDKFKGDPVKAISAMILPE